jgi:hypothetical protein
MVAACHIELASAGFLYKTNVGRLKGAIFLTGLGLRDHSSPIRVRFNTLLQDGGWFLEQKRRCLEEVLL